MNAKAPSKHALSNAQVKELAHDLDGIRANLLSCLRNLSADRRAQNPYAEIGFETLEKLNSIVERLNKKSRYE